MLAICIYNEFAMLLDRDVLALK